MNLICGDKNLISHRNILNINVQQKAPSIEQPCPNVPSLISKDSLHSVFISYNHASSSFVDDLEKSLESCAKVIRDKSSMKDWDSITNFMNAARKQDFCVFVITSEYLKSIPCMYEVSELMKDEDWKKKAFFAVLENELYKTDSTVFINYWQKIYDKLLAQSRAIKPQNMELITKSIKRVISIQQCFCEFYNAFCDANNPQVWEIIPAIIARISEH